MAKETAQSLRKQIAKDVKELNEGSKKQFGIKMPSNEGKEQEQSLQELMYSQMIMGSMASLIYGQKNVLDPNKVKPLLGKDSLYHIVSNLQTSGIKISNIPTALNVTVTKESITDLKTNLSDPIVSSINSLSQSLLEINKKSNKDKNDMNNEVIISGFSGDAFDDLLSIDSLANLIEDVLTIRNSLSITEAKSIASKLSKFIDLFNGIEKGDLSNFYAKNSKDGFVKQLENLIKVDDDRYDDFIKNWFIDGISDITTTLHKIKLDNPNNDANIRIIRDKLPNILKEIKNVNGSLEDIWLAFDEYVKNQKTESKDNSGVIELNIKGDSIADLEKFIENLNKLNVKDSKKLMSSLGNFTQFLKDISSKEFVNYLKNGSKNISEFAQLIGEPKKNETAKSISNVLKNIGILFSEVEEIDKDIDNFETAINSIIKIITIENKKINKNGLKDLLGVTDPDKGEIHTLLKNLDEITKDVNIEWKNINEIGEFFEGIAKIGDIGFIKRMRMKSNLKYFAKYIIKELPDIVKELDKSKSKIDNDKNFETLEAIGGFFTSLVKIADIDNKQRKQLRSNLEYIKKNVIKEICGSGGIIDEIVESINKSTEEGSEALKSLSDFFDKIFKVADFSFKQLLMMQLKLSYLSDIIVEQITGGNGQYKDAIIPNILHIQGLKFVKERIETLDSLFEMIEKMNQSIPSMKSVIMAQIKLSLYNKLTLPLLAYVIEKINTLTEPNLERYETILESINKAIEKSNSIDGLDKDKIANLFKFSKFIIDSNNEINKWLELVIDQQRLEEFFTIFSSVLDNINEIIKQVNESEELSENKVDVLFDFSEFISVFIDHTNKWTSAKLKEDKINEFFTVISSIFDDLNTSIIPKINELNIDESVEKKVTDSEKLIKSLSAIAKLGASAKLTKISIKALGGLAEQINDIVEKFKDTKQEDLDKAIVVVQSFTKLVAISAAILLFGALLMAKIKIANLILFTVSLSTFLFALSFTFKALSKTLDTNIATAEAACKLIAISGLTLIIGSILMTLIKPENLLLFTATLSVFLLAITGIFWLMSKLIDKSIDIAENAIKLIAISGLILIVGGLFMKIIRPEELFAFAAVLTGFLLLLTGIFWIYGKVNDGAMKAAGEAAILVGVSGGILILGGLFMKLINPGQLIMFAATLGLFLLGLVLIFRVAKDGLKQAMPGVIGAVIIVTVSAFILMIGALFMKDLNRAVGAIAFALVLGLFVWGIMEIFSKNSKNIVKAIPLASAFAIVTAVSAFTLLIAGGILAAYPNLILTIPLFGVLLWGFTWVMSKVLNNLAKNAKRLMIGAKIMAMLGGLIFEMSIAFRSLITTSKMIDDWVALVGTVALMGGVLLGLFFLAKAIGSNPESLGFMAAATAILAGLIGCIALIGIAVQEIAKGLADMARVSKMEVDFGNLAKLLLGFVGLVPALTAFGALIIPIGLGALSMKAMRGFLLDAATVIQAYASLKIPIYEGDKVVGYKIMSEKDFETSGKNIKSIVTTLFDTINEIYQKNPDMFKFSLSSLLTGGGGTVFGKVAAAGKGLAVMLSWMAFAVQEWADLKIPIYTGEKITGYKTIDNEAFVKAGENIKAVVVTLAQAVLDVYNNAPDKDMFEPAAFGLFGPSKFSKVCTSLKNMGDMLAVVAEGIETWADLKIPVYKKNSTEVSGYITIKDDDFVTAAENIKSVVTCLAGAVLDVYDERPELFDPQGWFGLGSSKFSIVCRALDNMGNALGSIANGVKEWSDLKIPVYKGTEVDHYLSLKDDDFITAGENISTVVSCLAQAIIDVYDENPTMFDSTGFLGMGDSKFAKVVGVMGPMGKALGDIANAVKDWSELKIPIYEGKDISGYLTLGDDDFQKVGENIDAVVTCLLTSIGSIYDAHNDWFDGGLFTDSPIQKVLDNIFPLGKSLKDIADAVQAWADLKIPVYGGTDKDGKPMITEYHTLGSGDFTKVTKNIDLVVTSLIRSVASLYEPHKEWFDGSGIFGLGKSPIGKVLGVIPPLGKTLKDIANAVQAWADLKIPVYGGLDKEGRPQISEYKTLGSKDFENATKNINKVVTSLVRSIASLYFDPQAKKEKWFDGGFFFGDSPIAKVLGAIEPLGNVVAGIAEGVTAFAEFKIPIYGIGKDGEAIITGYHTLADDQILKAGANIGRIVKLLAKTIGSLYFDKEAQAGQWFDKAHWWSSGTPFSKVITSLEPMGNMVGSIAEGIKNFADLKVPIYGKNNKGELAIVGYKTLADGDFDTATYNIGKIIMTLGMAIGAVVKNNPGVFDSTDSPVKKAAESIKLTGDTLSGVAGVIGAYASGKFPTLKYDSKGKLVPGAMVTLDDKNIEEMKKRVKAVIVALGESIIEVYDDPKAKRIFDSWQGTHFKQDAPAAIVSGSIKGLADALKGTLDVIDKIIELDFKKIAADFGGKDGFTHIFTTVISYMAGIYASISEPEFARYYNANGKYTTSYQKDGLAKYMNGKMSNLQTIERIAGSFSDNIDKIFKSLEKLYKSYESSKKTIDALQLVELGKAILNIINKIIIPVYNSSYILNDEKTYKDKLKNAEKVTERVNTSLKEIFKSLVKINKSYQDKDVQKAIKDLTGENSKFKNDLIKLIHDSTSSSERGLINQLCNDICISNSQDILKEAVKKNKTILRYLVTSINVLLRSVTKLVKAYQQHKENIEFILTQSNTGDSKFEYVNKVNSLLILVRSLANIIVNETYTGDIKDFIKKIYINKQIAYQVNTLINDIQELGSKDKELTDISFGNVETAVTNFITCINKIKAALNGATEDNSMSVDLFGLVKLEAGKNKEFELEQLVQDTSDILDVVNKLLDIANVAKNIDGTAYDSISTGLGTIHSAFSTVILVNKEEIDYFIKYLNDFINVIDLIYDYTDFSSKCNSLKDGILNVYAITTAIEQNETFNQHTLTLKDYVQTINSIDLGKLQSLQTFVDSMNQLSNRLGNLDNLTDAIANRLSMVLYELVNQLTKADASIKNAHTLQAKRKKLIDEAMEKIQTLMDKPMVVQISQVDMSQQTETDKQTVKTGTINGQKTTGGEGEVDVATDKAIANNYKEETNAEDQTYESGQNDKKALTYNEFISFMNDTYLKKIKNVVR